MSGAQFTKGPWLIHAERRWVVPAEDAFKEPADALPVCQLRDPDERLTEDETLSNGFLMAAAPELYEALEAIADESVFSQLRFAEDTDTDYFMRCFKAVKERARAALAKARGQ